MNYATLDYEDILKQLGDTVFTHYELYVKLREIYSKGICDVDDLLQIMETVISLKPDIIMYYSSPVKVTFSAGGQLTMFRMWKVANRGILLGYK